jgi:hypothetical protein
MSISTTNLAALSSDKWNRTCPCLYPLSRRRRWSRARLLCRQTTLVLLEKDRSRRSLRWSMTPKSIRTDIILCMNHPPRVQRGHVRRPGHSAGRAVRDGYTCLGIGRDCSGWNYDGGLGIRRGCDRRMRSSSLATAPIVSSIARQKRSAASIFPGRPGKSKGPFRASQEGTGTDTPPAARSAGRQPARARKRPASARSQSANQLMP